MSKKTHKGKPKRKPVSKANAVAKAKSRHISNVNRRVQLGGVDTEVINRLAGFKTDKGTTTETRLSDNLLRAVLYVFRGFEKRKEKVEQMGGTFQMPTYEEILTAIMDDDLVRQRIRELVAQANITAMSRVPVKLPNDPESDGCTVMSYVFENFALAFDDENRPATIPHLTPLFVGAPPKGSEGPQPGTEAASTQEEDAVTIEGTSA